MDSSTNSTLTGVSGAQRVMKPSATLALSSQLETYMHANALCCKSTERVVVLQALQARLKPVVEELRQDGPPNLVSLSSLIRSLLALLESCQQQAGSAAFHPTEFHVVLGNVVTLARHLGPRNPCEAADHAQALQAVEELLKQQALRRVATLLQSSTKTEVGSLVNAAAMRLLAKTIMTWHNWLSRMHAGNTAAQLVAELFQSQELRTSLRCLIYHASRSTTPATQQQAAEVGIVAKWLSNLVPRSLRKPMDANMTHEHLAWILGVQVESLQLQLGLMKRCPPTTPLVNPVISCLGPTYTSTWVLPELLHTARLIVKGMTEYRTLDPNPAALDTVLPVLPQVLSVAHDVLATRTVLGGALPHNSTSVTAEQAAGDAAALSMVGSVVHLCMQCMACSAPSCRRAISLNHTLINDGRLLVLLSHATRLASDPDAQLQQVLNVGGIINFLSHWWRPTDFQQHHVAELVLAGRRMLAGVLQHMQQPASQQHQQHQQQDTHTPAGGSGRVACVSPSTPAGHDEAGDAVAVLCISGSKAAGAEQQVSPLAGPDQGTQSSGSEAQSGIALAASTPHVSTSRAVLLDRSKVYHTVVHLMGAVHNLTWCTQRSLRSTQDACMTASNLAAQLQWHWLPLTTAILELALQQEVCGLTCSPDTQPAGQPTPLRELLPDLEATCATLELQAVAATELVDGQGHMPWQLVVAGSPAGLHVLASLLNYCALALPAQRTWVEPSKQLVKSMVIVSDLAAAMVRTLDSYSPLRLKQQAEQQGRRTTGGAANHVQQDVSFSGPTHSPSSYLGPGWSCTCWGYAVLAVWQAAQALAAATPLDSAWHNTGCTMAGSMSVWAVQLLLRGAEEVLAGDGDEARWGTGASSATAHQANLQRLDAVRERLAVLQAAHDVQAREAATEPNKAGLHCDAAHARKAQEGCIALAKALQPFFPGASATPASSATKRSSSSSIGGDVQTGTTGPDADSASLTSVELQHESVSKVSEPWTLAWYENPMSWVHWEAAVHRLPATQRGCSNPRCSRVEGCGGGDVLAFMACPACRVARFCSQACVEAANLQGSGHAHTCRRLQQASARAAQASKAGGAGCSRQ